MFWIDVNWNQLGLCRSSLDLCFLNAVRLSTWAIYKDQFKSLDGEQSVVLAFYAGAQNAHVPLLKFCPNSRIFRPGGYRDCFPICLAKLLVYRIRPSPGTPLPLYLFNCDELNTRVNACRKCEAVGVTVFTVWCKSWPITGFLQRHGRVARRAFTMLHRTCAQTGQFSSQPLFASNV